MVSRVGGGRTLLRARFFLARESAAPRDHPSPRPSHSRGRGTDPPSRSLSSLENLLLRGITPPLAHAAGYPDTAEMTDSTPRDPLALCLLFLVRCAPALRAHVPEYAPRGARRAACLTGGLWGVQPI